MSNKTQMSLNVKTSLSAMGELFIMKINLSVMNMNKWIVCELKFEFQKEKRNPLAFVKKLHFNLFACLLLNMVGLGNL